MNKQYFRKISTRASHLGFALTLLAGSAFAVGSEDEAEHTQVPHGAAVPSGGEEIQFSLEGVDDDRERPSFHTPPIITFEGEQVVVAKPISRDLFEIAVSPESEEVVDNSTEGGGAALEPQGGEDDRETPPISPIPILNLFENEHVVIAQPIQNRWS